MSISILNVANSVVKTKTVSASLWKTLQAFNVARLIFATILMVAFGLQENRDSWNLSPQVFGVMAVVYLGLASSFVILNIRWQQYFQWQLIAQVLTDSLFISALYLGLSGSKSGIGILYLFPLSGLAILGSLVLALFITSLISIFLILATLFLLLQANDSGAISQSGFYGVTFFAVVILLNRLAKKLIEQEDLAKKRGQLLAHQQAINRTVIDDMEDGVLVVDLKGHIWEANPSARQLLRLQNLPSKKSLKNALLQQSSLQPIQQALANWIAHYRALKTQEIASFVTIRHTENALSQQQDLFEVSSHLKLRFVWVKSLEKETADPIGGNTQYDWSSFDEESYIAIYLQDVMDIENRAQELKLASMGRLTASIAHEVRNPLASISYANSLLSEESENNPQFKRLVKIVDDNVARLNQMVEDILKLSRKAQSHVEPYSIQSEVQDILQEFIETRHVLAGLIEVFYEDDFMVSFDRCHLREILFNLLSNALRYCSGQAASIRVMTKKNSQYKELHVQDDGPRISNEVRSHLFEPFYTTSSKGTGLGLYMARELCLNNHAYLDYEFRNDESYQNVPHSTGRFVLRFN